MTHAPVQPGVTATYTVKGYTVHITPDSNGVHHISCPDLPQLSGSDGSLSGALAMAEDAINVILAGRDHAPPKGA
jgi:predicted RNase H-like HicB family nuclease